MPTDSLQKAATVPMSDAARLAASAGQKRSITVPQQSALPTAQAPNQQAISSVAAISQISPPSGSPPGPAGQLNMNELNATMAALADPSNNLNLNNAMQAQLRVGHCER